MDDRSEDAPGHPRAHGGDCIDAAAVNPGWDPFDGIDVPDAMWWGARGDNEADVAANAFEKKLLAAVGKLTDEDWEDVRVFGGSVDDLVKKVRLAYRRVVARRNRGGVVGR